MLVNQIQPMQNEVPLIARRQMLLSVGAAALVTATAGCASMGALNLVTAIRELLGLSSKRALAKLMAPEGFLNDALTKVVLPQELGGALGGQVLGNVMQATGMMKQLEKQANRVAEKAAAEVAPTIADGINALDIPNPMAVLNGSPQAATQLLKQALGQKLMDQALPVVSDFLGGGGIAGILSQVLGANSVMDKVGLGKDIANKISAGIFNAIGREEEAIRADPNKGGSALLKKVLG